MPNGANGQIPLPLTPTPLNIQTNIDLSMRLNKYKKSHKLAEKLN